MGRTQPLWRHGRSIAILAPMPDQLPRTTYLIGRLDRTIRRALEDLIRDQAVTVLGYTALTVLADRPGLSNAQLARRSFMTPQGMNQALAVLTERGLVDRRPDELNRRVQRLELTPKGAEVVEICAERVDRFEQQLLVSLTVDEQAELNSLLRRVVDGTRMT
jgi:DNA-binding MarR family transcriptional regulator